LIDNGTIVDELGLAFLDAADECEDTNDDLHYFDPSDDIPEDQLIGHAFHLLIDFDKIISSNDVDDILNKENFDALCGNKVNPEEFDTFAYVSYRVRKEKKICRNCNLSWDFVRCK
jgi:hypothetical protein